MHITRTDARDGLIVVHVADETRGHEIVLNSLDAAHLIGCLRVSLEDAIGHPSADSMELPGIERVQIVENKEMVLFRIYMNHRVSHDYPLPKGTVLADELLKLADRVEAHNSATATHRPPEGGPSGKMH